MTEPELSRIFVITEHFLIPVTAQYLPMYFTLDANRIFLLYKRGIAEQDRQTNTVLSMLNLLFKQNCLV